MYKWIYLINKYGYQIYERVITCWKEWIYLTCHCYFKYILYIKSGNAISNTSNIDIENDIEQHAWHIYNYHYCLASDIYDILWYQSLLSEYTPCRIMALFRGTEFNELMSVLQKYKGPVTMCHVFTCRFVNLVCVSRLIVKIIPEKHPWDPDSWM